MMHYSDKILEQLEHLGWQKAAAGLVKQVAIAESGELSKGARCVVASFCDRSRYLVAKLGWDDLFDVDCRGRDIAEVAIEFDRKVSELGA